MVNAQQKGKCGKPNHSAKVCKSININAVNYEDDNTLEHIKSFIHNVKWPNIL